MLMEQFNMDLIDDIIFMLLDQKLREINTNNPEIVQQNNKITEYERTLSLIMGKLSEKDRDALDDYLSMNNYVESLLLSDIYKSGFTDCIKLLKAVNII